MPVSYKTRRIGSLLLLTVGLPIYIVVALNVVDLFEIQSKLLELVVFVVLGFLWALPFRWLFLGVGRADPDAPPPEQDRNGR